LFGGKNGNQSKDARQILQKYNGGREVVEVNANTIGECLRKLVAYFPDMKRELFQESGIAMSEIIIFVNGKVLYLKI
jgi:arsenate reductase-like glutaredoxin family protein